MNHDGKKPLSLSPDPEKAVNGTQHHGMRIHRGIPIPRHMLAPDQEGYRTPTIEDYEHHYGHFNRTVQSQILARPSSPLSNCNVSSPAVYENQSANRSRFSLHLELEKLGWTQRLRHFTWTFFTMTMATGGIANVLHAGEEH